MTFEERKALEGRRRMVRIAVTVAIMMFAIGAILSALERDLIFAVIGLSFAAMMFAHAMAFDSTTDSIERHFNWREEMKRLG